jgi:hypothetical protein
MSDAHAMETLYPERANDPDFFGCCHCGRLITKLEVKENLHTGTLCPCGGKKFRSANMRWYHWFLPRVLRFAYLRVRKLA